jgi:hypothetical protein
MYDYQWLRQQGELLDEFKKSRGRKLRVSIPLSQWIIVKNCMPFLVEVTLSLLSIECLFKSISL